MANFSRRSFRGARTDHHGKPIILGPRFQAGSHIDGVAEHRIVEAEIRSHVADDAGAGVEPDPDAQRHVKTAVRVSFAFEFDVKCFGARQHLQRGLAGIGFVVRIVHRSIPECHDGVANVFVDRALAFDDGVGQWREEAVHQVGEALGIVLVVLGDRGEASNVREQYGHPPFLAAQYQLLRRPGELLDQLRRR